MTARLNAWQTSASSDESCGNGILETTEGCDDGNIIDGDGCSALCVEETYQSSSCRVSDSGSGPDDKHGLWWLLAAAGLLGLRRKES